jgi:hypothetical protein
MPKITRDAVFFVVGLAGVFHETALHAGPERPFLLALFGFMLGLPALARLDEWRRPPED